MTERLVESLNGVGVIHVGEVPLRTTSYTLSVWSHDEQNRSTASDPRATVRIDGHIDISGVGEAVVLAGPDNLTLTLADGRRIAFELTGSAGAIAGRGWLS